MLCSLMLVQKNVPEAEKAAAEMRPGKQQGHVEGTQVHGRHL